MIYAIQSSDGPVKIGVTRQLAGRLNELQIGNSCTLRVLAELALANDKEGLIHDYLSSEWIRGEWFKPSAKTMEVVEYMTRGMKQSDDDDWLDVMDLICARDTKAVFKLGRRDGLIPNSMSEAEHAAKQQAFMFKQLGKEGLAKLGVVYAETGGCAAAQHVDTTWWDEAGLE